MSSSRLPSASRKFQLLYSISGVDPKSVVCEFFRRGQCAKGFKCKYSHDLNVERKGEKIDLYSDQRDNETMEEWDQETLEKVVESKGNEYMNNKPTEIVCKYFLDAVEKKQYGWFWVCPNGGKDCHYRHALPPGYVLKSQMKALLEEEAEKLSIEEEIEEQRTKVSTTTPLNATIFSEWKKRKEQEREAMLAQKRAERAKNDRMSGRELFASDASLFVDDLEACDEYERDEEEPGSSSKAQDSKATDTAVTAAAGSSSASADPAEIDEDDEAIPDVEDDDLDEDELNELEARLASSGVGGDT
ncbi:zinc finger CCCH domain-containing protein 11 isoform X2 [Selaginella moellendorffii]|uniref:zinc finger CCCH domain-containing protein 11 isoform X2 n=1 Tax=Selaginella moellendorffii TaxID=88036 RepID=UPI000D1CDA73|nr:zinc finger CCCH domain-containing protein 11 isoform X2 [Selaginella moellendorffii]|eukprot:XP_024524224.1 zinc finger CCCH domain-containing protein 11 isoform X2 [Selaginella moellendorffii]